MDKNTLTGLILIGALILGFTWLNQSNPEVKPLVADSISTPITSEQSPAMAEASGDVPTLDSVAQATLQAYKQARPVKVVELNNGLLSVKLSTQGGTPTEAVLHRYQSQYGERSGQPVRLFASEDIRINFPMRTLSNEIVNTADAYFEVVSQTDSTLVMRLLMGANSYLDFAYTLRANDYRLGFDLVGVNLQDVLPANVSLQDIEWSQRIPQQEQSHRFESQYSGVYYYSKGGTFDDLTANKEEEQIKESLRWVAVKDKYFSSALINHSGSFDDSRVLIEAQDEHSGYIHNTKIKSTFPFSVRDGAQARFTFFFGPNDYELLSGYDKGLDSHEQIKLDHLVYLGVNIFRWLNLYLIIPTVNFLKGFLSNWGLIILLLTIFIKLLLSPFTFKSYMSQAKMRELKPQIDVINSKYEGKTDQESMLKKQQETMALYSSAGASPLSGCLPTLLQMPFLIALYMYFPTSILLRGEGFLWAHDLSTYDPIISWDFDIPLVSSLLGNHISLFCLLMTVVNIVYNKYMMSQGGGGSEAMPGMKMMPYMMSIMFFFMFNQNASGLSYYYFVSTLITILQYFAFRWTLDEPKLLAQLEENKKKPRKKSKWMQRLEEAQKLQREQQRQRK